MSSPPPPPPSQPGQPGRAARPKFELERWLGVRGAAVLGGISLIVAGFLFLQYSIDRGWVTPEVRLIAGAVTGGVCLLVQHFLRGRGYGILSNSLTGAGLVILYAVAWAAHRMYGVLEFLPAFAAMVAVTALCGVLSYRYASQLVAVLGLIGGFATPVALSTGADRPLGLFGYSLLLDFAFLFVAHKRRWPRIGLVALLCTFVIQGLWIGRRMDGGDLLLAVGVLAVFGLLFAVVSALRPKAEQRQWFAPQVAALVLPFVYALYFAQHAEFGRHLVPLALLGAVLSLTGGVLAQLQGTPWLSLGSVSGTLGLVLVWTLRSAGRMDASLALELTGTVVGLAVIQLCLAEWQHRRSPGERAAATTAAVACTGLAFALAIACGLAEAVPLMRWIPAAALLPLVLQRLLALGAPAVASCLGSLCAGAGLAAWAVVHAAPTRDPSPLGLGLIFLGLGALVLAAARRLGELARRAGFFAASCFLMSALVALAAGGAVPPPRAAAFLLVLFATGGLLALAANGARSVLLFALAVLGTLLAGGASDSVRIDELAQRPDWALQLGALGLGLALFTFWPFFAPASMAARAGLWRVAAVSQLPWFLVAHALWSERHGGHFGAAMPLAFAAFLGLCARLLWKRGEPEVDAAARSGLSDAARREALRTLSFARCWYGSMALLYVGLALPLYVDPRLERYELHGLAVSASLASLFWIAWWQRSDHRGLKYLAALLGVCAAIRLGSSALFESHAAAATRVFNERGYWVLLPAVALIAAAVLVNRREGPRLRGVEARWLPTGLLPATAALSVAGLALLFAWLNIEVADAFAEESSDAQRVRWSLRGAPGVGLATSIAWALMALVILGVGVARKLGALRWASLVLFLATIAKVFLLDLAHLRGLFRVAAILGLALSLFLVSFLYQRFVFRPARADQEPQSR
ncbi:MAG: DUF2339 domain-containing protein [Planctomycetes bacterium]|nr:DUF2339 domain-containing protein [Planctomycetota bacterium]